MKKNEARPDRNPVVDRLFCDKQGRLVLMQRPNAPIVGWVFFTLLARLIDSATWQDLFSFLAFGFLFTWAWLEIVAGESLFRRVLGILVVSVALYNRVA